MEEALIQRAQLGDTAAFRQLVEAHTALAWRTARVLLPNRAAAEDALQEAWVDVWRGLAGFHAGRPFRPWLLAVVANRCRMSARRHALATVPLPPADSAAFAGPDHATDAVLRGEADAELRAALALLPDDQRRVLELRYFAELDLSEIAAITDAPLGTVKSRLHRALGAVRAVLAKDPAFAVWKGDK